MAQSTDWVMSSTANLSNHPFTGQASSSKQLTSIVHILFARNWKLPFLNQWKGQNDRRKYFVINLHEKMLPAWWGSNLQYGSNVSKQQ